MTMEWEQQYKIIQKEMLAKVGFDFDTLTENQIDVILQPSEAPENYMCDGEISGDQAFHLWQRKLKNEGLSKQQIEKAIQLNFG